MTRITASRVIDASQTKVWAALADLGTHAEWMLDATSVDFIGQRTSGLGTRMAVETRIGPFRTLDVIEVVGWDEGRSIEVEHQGVVRGRGVLSVSTDGSRTVLTWEETIRFPWWLGGQLAAWLAQPVLAAVMRADLGRLGRRVASP